MRFIESYKRLEKLCNEIYGSSRGISLYIDEMLGTPVGARYVAGWEEDLKRLKHYRWVRNQISHEPSCTEDNMCEPGDDLWIDGFHSRIMSGTDPLTLYHKAIEPKIAQKPKQTNVPQSKPYTHQQHTQPSTKPAGCLTFVLSIAVAVIAVAVFLMFV